MSLVSEMIAKRVIKKVAGNGAVDVTADGANPIMMGLVKSFGIDISQITAFAESLKATVQTTLEAMAANQREIIERLDRMENLMLTLKDEHNVEAQLSDMMTHPLTEPINDGAESR